MIRRKFYLAALFTITVWVGLTACSKESKQQDPVTLKVLSWSERIFYERYGNVFLATHPNYDLDVISMIDYIEPGENLNNAIERITVSESPDILSLTMDYYSVLQEKDLLEPLSPFIQKDKLDLTTFTPSVLDFLQNEQSELFGLAPTFTGKALFYNKKLFNEQQIAEPTDFMTWDEVFTLAQRFPQSMGDQLPLYSFYYREMSPPFFMAALTIGESSGLTLYANGTFTLNTEGWNDVFRNVIECVQAKSCYGYSDFTNNDAIVMEADRYPFLQGNIAMAVEDSNLFNVLKNNSKYKDLDWGIVSYPVTAQYPDTGNTLELNEIFAISANSGQTDAAWEFLSYISSDDYLRMLHRLIPDELPAHMVDQEQLDPDVAAFYKLKHVNSSMTNNLRALPTPVVLKIDELSSNYLSEVLAGSMALDEALQALETELQHILNENIKQDPAEP